MTDRTLATDTLAALKAIRRWCDVNDHHTDSADKVRNIRLVAADYLSRAGIPDAWAPPRERKPRIKPGDDETTKSHTSNPQLQLDDFIEG